MFLIGKAHPDLQDSEQTGQRGPWLSEAEKRETIDAFYAEKQRVPLSLNHKNVGRFGYVPRDDVIGEVLDLYNNSDGELMVRCALSQKHDAYGEINESVFLNKVRWGFSVGLAQLPDEGHTHKLLTHMALTPDPGFAAHDTHLFNYHTSEDLLNARIAQDLYAPGQGKTYGTPEFEAKLKRMHNICFIARFMHCATNVP